MNHGLCPPNVIDNWSNASQLNDILKNNSGEKLKDQGSNNKNGMWKKIPLKVITELA